MFNIVEHGKVFYMTGNDLWHGRPSLTLVLLEVSSSLKRVFPSHCHQLLNCIIVGCLPYDIKHLEVITVMFWCYINELK